MSEAVLSVAAVAPASAPPGVALADLLDVDAQRLQDVLAAHIGRHAGAQALPAAVLGLLAEDAAQVLCKELRVDPLGLALRAWAAIRELQDYADPRKHPPGETAILRWGRCSIQAPQAIGLALEVLGVKLPVLRFTIALEAQFHSLALTIRDGAVLKASPGPAKVSASLKCGDTTIVDECSTPELSLPAAITFEPALPIGWAPAGPPRPAAAGAA